MKKGIISVMVANVFCLVISLITNFILPKYLSLNTYAQIKEYALFISYAGFFSLGYNDGMYLKYGGKLIDELKRDELAENIKSYFFLEVMVLLCIMFVGIILRYDIIIAFAFGMLANNILGYLKSLYQATGDFTGYSQALNLEKVAVLIANVVIIFVLKSDNYNFYIWAQVLVGLLIMLFLFSQLNKKIEIVAYGKVSFREIKENIKDGFILMLGNFSSSIFTGLDRWFVKILLGTANFAFYSFAVSMENLLNIFITPITVSMYNYFCAHDQKEQIRKIKSIVLIWGFIIIAAAFPAKWILEVFIPSYIEASNIIFLLFASQAFYVVIKGIYVNIFKAQKEQNKYLKQMIAMIIIAFILNILLYRVFKSNEGIAMATLITSLLWLIVCEWEYKEYRYKLNEILAGAILLIVFLVCGYTMSAFIGGIVYCITGVVVGLIFMRKNFIEMINLVSDIPKQAVNTVLKRR